LNQYVTILSKGKEEEEKEHEERNDDKNQKIRHLLLTCYSGHDIEKMFKTKFIDN